LIDRSGKQSWTAVDALKMLLIQLAFHNQIFATFCSPPLSSETVAWEKRNPAKLWMEMR